MNKIVSLLVMSIILSACAAAPASTSTPVPLGTPTKPLNADCSPPANWTIEYQRSGGIGGFNQSLTLESGGSLTVESEHPPVDKQLTLPEDHVEPIRDLLVQACPFEVARAEGVCADCFNYELNIQMDEQFFTIMAQDTTLPEDLQPLIDTLNEFLQMAGQ